MQKFENVRSLNPQQGQFDEFLFYPGDSEADFRWVLDGMERASQQGDFERDGVKFVQQASWGKSVWARLLRAGHINPSQVVWALAETPRGGIKWVGILVKGKKVQSFDLRTKEGKRALNELNLKVLNWAEKKGLL